MDKLQAALDVMQKNITKEYGSKGIEALAVAPEQATPWQKLTQTEIAATETDPFWMNALAAQLIRDYESLLDSI